MKTYFKNAFGTVLGIFAALCCVGTIPAILWYIHWYWSEQGPSILFYCILFVALIIVAFKWPRKTNKVGKI